MHVVDGVLLIKPLGAVEKESFAFCIGSKDILGFMILNEKANLSPSFFQ